VATTIESVCGYNLNEGAKKSNQAKFEEMSLVTSPLPPSYIADESLDRLAEGAKNSNQANNIDELSLDTSPLPPSYITDVSLESAPAAKLNAYSLSE
jgi:hypothetical protein